MARACGLTVTTLTSGSGASTAAVADWDPSQPARNGAIAASITEMQADGA
jgi:hypothetical protein